MNTKTQLEAFLGKNRIKENFSLAPYLTLRTQPRAEYYFEAVSREDLIKAKKAAIELDLPFLMIGGGSNLAILVDILKGLVVRNRYIEKRIEEMDDTFGLLTVSGGYPVTKLARELAQAGYEGLEYHFGLPGTVGGALFMNSKWTKPLTYFGDTLVSALLLDPKGNEKKVDRNYFQFAYDTSILQSTKEIVVEATFRLKKSDPSTLIQHTQFASEYRKRTQPHGVFCSGCFFQNVDGQSAGKLIDQAGLKGKRLGQFHVSGQHANFIIHDGGGKPEDLKKLLELIKQTVKEKHGVELKQEVIVI